MNEIYLSGDILPGLEQNCLLPQTAHHNTAPGTIV